MITPEVVQFISAVGFPIAAAIGVAYAAWRIAWEQYELTKKYLLSQEETQKDLLHEVRELRKEITRICKAGEGGRRASDCGREE